MSQQEHKSDVQVDRAGRVAIIRIDAGPVNAARPKTMVDLCAALEAARDDTEVGAVVLGHTGAHFVAGADFAFLESLKTATPQNIRDDIYRHFQGAARLLYNYPKPTVAAIGGAAITVGCEAALACDFRVVTPRAFFQESWIRIGLLPPLGGLKTLATLVGYGRAYDMVLRGRKVPAAQAIEIGLAHEMVEPEELEPRAIALAAELAQAPPLAYRAAKAELRRALHSSLEDTFAASVNAQALLILSDDFREGVDAASAQRAPRFRGV